MSRILEKDLSLKKINKNVFVQNKKKILIYFIPLFLLMFIILGLIYKNRNVSDYQAVFLENGQVYFGEIKQFKGRNGTLRLNDVFYLKLDGENVDLKNDSSDITLIKLGNELHGPDSYMDIMKNKILFIEDLKDDSKVVRSMEKYSVTEANN